MDLNNENKNMMEAAVFEKYESNVRSYCRKYPVIFTRAKGSLLYDQDNHEYIDFLCGAGSCNYGHNNDYIKGKVLDYLAGDGLLHGLDMYSIAKGEFIQTLQNLILKPRGYDYKVLFPGPTGTNAVEAALKIARKAKHRSNIFAMMGGFHGMSLGSLAATSERNARDACGITLGNVTHIPHPSMMPEMDTIAYMDILISNDHSGVEKPAALIVETVQGEGGINVLSSEWLRAARELCDKHDVLLIIDDIQTGCGRTGSFFSFERAGIKPDIVVMAKSIGGIGMPAAITLVKPEYDVLLPGEHNGTFRGFQLAFIAGKAALECLINDNLEAECKRKEGIIRDYLNSRVPKIADNLEVRGMGVMWGVDFGKYSPLMAYDIRRKCFEHGVILELCGREDTVVKIMAAMTIPVDTLLNGLKIVCDVMEEAVQNPIE